MNFTEDIIRTFSDKIRNNIAIHLDSFYTFMTNSYPSIVRYYEGDLDVLDNEIIDDYNNIKKTFDKIAEIITYRQDSFDKMIDWEIIDYIESIRDLIAKIPKLYKWYRSSKTDFNFSNKFEFNYTTTKNDSLEKITKSISSRDYQDDWHDIAFRNSLFEVDYDRDSGQTMLLSIDLSSNNLRIESILDNAQGKKVLGLDIQKQMVIEDNDLKVLDHDATFLQSVKILTNLLKGDIPEFLELGRNSLVGSTVKNFALSSIVRQMVNLFSTDDSIVNFQIENTQVQGDSVFIEFSAQSRMNNIIQNQLQV